MQCLNCNNEHNGDYGSGRYCSKKCGAAMGGRAGKGTELKKNQIKTSVKYRIQLEKLHKNQKYAAEQNRIARDNHKYICEGCGNEKIGIYGSGRFCSSKCSRSFSCSVKREETNIKISEGVKRDIARRKSLGIDEYRKQCYKKWEKARATSNKRVKQILLDTPIENLSFERLRKRIIHEQENKCNRCKNHEWLGVSIPLEIDHIDGNNTNNNRDNIEMLCPNCHSLTPTWRGRNKKTKRGFKEKRISDELLAKAIIKNNYNFRKALIEVGMAAKGANYKRCYKIKGEIDSTRTD